jgi:hypothetical protein
MIHMYYMMNVDDEDYNYLDQILFGYTCMFSTSANL